MSDLDNLTQKKPHDYLISGSVIDERLRLARELFVIYATHGNVEPITAACLALAGATAFLELACSEGLLQEHIEDDQTITGDKCLEDIETGAQWYKREMDDRLKRARSQNGRGTQTVVSPASGAAPNGSGTPKLSLVRESDSLLD